MEPPSDRDLIAQALAGDQTAFAVLVARYGRAVYARIARTVRYPEDVEDLVQDVFVTAYTRLRQLKDGDRFPAWLRAIADNLTRMWRRRRFVQLRLEEMLEPLSNEMVSSEDQAKIQELKTALREALRSLSEAHRQVIVHHYFKGYTYLETAELLNIQTGTVRSRLQKARHRLKEEVISMNGKDIRPQTFELTREDLNALRWAAVFVSRDETRPVLQGVYLDTGGRMVACDGHRLLVWPSERLSAIAAPVLLGPWFHMEIPDVDRGTLSIGEQEAILRIPSQKDRVAPVIEAPYVQYEKVIPTAWSICVKVPTGALLEVIDLIADHTAPRHPVDPEGTWQYRPAVEIRLSIPAQTLSLITTREMGYSRSGPDGKHLNWSPQEDETGPPVGAPDWTFTASIPAQVETDGPEEVFRIGVNHTYLSDAVRVLELDRSEVAEVRFIDPLKPMLFSPVHRPDWKSMLMPLRLKAPADSGQDRPTTVKEA